MLSLTEKEKENALNEVRILASIDHPNVIGFKDAFIDEIIRPHNTRKRICRALQTLRNKQVQKPWKKHDNLPL